MVATSGPVVGLSLVMGTAFEIDEHCCSIWVPSSNVGKLLDTPSGEMDLVTPK